MYEQLNSGNVVDDAGDVVPFDDYRELIEASTPEETEDRQSLSGPISNERLAMSSLLDAQKRNRRDRLTVSIEHPVVPGETIEQEAPQFQLGTAAQNALDVYMEQTERFRKLGATEHRATKGPHYQHLMITLTKARSLGISSDEVNAILALVSPAVVTQKSHIKAGEVSAIERPVYRDARSAAAHDY